MATNFTATVTQVVLNNQGSASTVTSRTVPTVVVGNNVVPDFRETNPGVINSVYTEYPNSRAF